jgi:small subunit ribosomal protein S13
MKDLTLSEVDQLTRIISQYYYIELDLKRLVQQDLSHLVKVGSYRGLRHAMKLPVRGQRTHTNAKTAKASRSWARV